MGIRKTERDLKRAAIAQKVSEQLIEIGMSCVGGGQKGPYTLTIDRLNRAQLARVVELLRSRESEWR
jgi:hypothetical protein